MRVRDGERDGDRERERLSEERESGERGNKRNMYYLGFFC